MLGSLGGCYRCVVAVFWVRCRPFVAHRDWAEGLDVAGSWASGRWVEGAGFGRWYWCQFDMHALGGRRLLPCCLSGIRGRAFVFRSGLRSAIGILDTAASLVLTPTGLSLRLSGPTRPVTRGRLHGFAGILTPAVLRVLRLSFRAAYALWAGMLDLSRELDGVAVGTVQWPHCLHLVPGKHGCCSGAGMGGVIWTWALVKPDGSVGWQVALLLDAKHRTIDGRMVMALLGREPACRGQNPSCSHRRGLG
jgi:hypothetical protein